MFLRLCSLCKLVVQNSRQKLKDSRGLLSQFEIRNKGLLLITREEKNIIQVHDPCWSSEISFLLVIHPVPKISNQWLCCLVLVNGSAYFRFFSYHSVLIYMSPFVQVCNFAVECELEPSLKVRCVFNHTMEMLAVMRLLHQKENLDINMKFTVCEYVWGSRNM